jgi:hypothetical protein
MSQNVLFAQIQKVDEAKRLVYGRATQEVVDRSGEIFDYASSKPNFQKWSNEAVEATDGKSLGNVRAMHSNVAVGKVTELNFNDDEHAIDVVAKVVDDNEWDKVLEGVYTGFSIGGSYQKRWKDGDQTRYTADPSEISLVDRPCCQTATFFDVQKADGSLAKVDFKAQPETPELTEAPVVADPVAKSEGEYEVTGSEEDVARLAKMLNDHSLTVADVITITEGHLAKKDKAPEGEKQYGDVAFADAANKKYPIDTEEHIRAAWNYINKQKNADKYSADDLKAVKDKIIAAWKDKIDKDGPPSAEKADTGTPGKSLRKGMYNVSDLAYLINSMSYLLSSVSWEESIEQDGSDIGSRLAQAMADLGQILVDMTTEEVQELVAAMGGNVSDVATASGADIDVDILELADAAKGLQKRAGEMVKTGARNSKPDQNRIQQMHDMSVELGAACADSGTADKAHAPDGLAKRFDETQQQLTKALELNDALQKNMDAVEERLKKLEAQPMPPKAVLRAVAKADDIGSLSATPEVAPVVSGTNVNEAATEIKKVHASGGRPLSGGL